MAGEWLHTANAAAMIAKRADATVFMSVVPAGKTNSVARDDIRQRNVHKRAVTPGRYRIRTHMPTNAETIQAN
jgi:hypothetical protein